MEPCPKLPIALQTDDHALFYQLIADLDVMHATAGNTLNRFLLAESRLSTCKVASKWNVRRAIRVHRRRSHDEH